MKEFSPLDEFTHLFRYWWVIVIGMLLGGLAAYIFHLSNPPLYEATATIMATIDLQTFPFKGVREDLIQYNEDMALGTVEGVLRSHAVVQDLFSALQSQAFSLDAASFARSSTIERKHDIWEIRYRSTNPAAAQTVVNTWIEIGYQAMQTWQANGRIPPFVILDPPTPAFLPETPIIFQLNNLLLAGSVAGFLLGVMFTMLLHKPKSLHFNHQHDKTPSAI